MKGSIPEFAHSYLHFSIMVFIDLLQSPFQPLQFRLSFPLQPANGLRHPRFVSHPQPLAHPSPTRRGVLAQPPRQHLLFPSSLPPLRQLPFCQSQRRQPARQQPLGFRLTVRPLGLPAIGAASPLTQRLLHQRQHPLLEFRPAHIPSPPNRFPLLCQFLPAPLETHLQHPPFINGCSSSPRHACHNRRSEER